MHHSAWFAIARHQGLRVRAVERNCPASAESCAICPAEEAIHRLVRTGCHGVASGLVASAPHRVQQMHRRDGGDRWPSRRARPGWCSSTLRCHSTQKRLSLRRCSRAGDVSTPHGGSARPSLVSASGWFAVSPSSPVCGHGSGARSIWTHGSSKVVGPTRPFATTKDRSRQFMDYLCDPRYGWRTECEQRVGEVPVQICARGEPCGPRFGLRGPPRAPAVYPRRAPGALRHCRRCGRRTALRSPHKGWLSAFRDATLLKVIYAWGLRRTEAAMLDVCDFSENPAAPELGRFGMLAVRYGKAMRGSPPKRRAVASVMPWAAEVIDQYVRRRPSSPRGARSWPSAVADRRGTRISSRRIDERFAEWRKTARSFPRNYRCTVCGTPTPRTSSKMAWTRCSSSTSSATPGPLRQPSTRPSVPTTRTRCFAPRSIVPFQRKDPCDHRRKGPTVDYLWHLRSLMAERELFSTTDLLPLLAARGVVLSREQVYRLVAKVPERLNLTTLAALCDIFECSPGDLIEVTASEGRRARASTDVRRSGSPGTSVHVRARVARNTSIVTEDRRRAVRELLLDRMTEADPALSRDLVADVFDKASFSATTLSA